MTATTSLCSVCLQTVPAEIIIGVAVWIEKRCSQHGVERTMIERDPEFYAAYHRWQKPETWHAHFNVCAINTTDRCQLATECPACYHMPKQAPDPTIDEIVAVARQAKAGSVMLMGAEPTVRNDLHELIPAIKAARGGRVSMCTNGLRLADPAYVERLKAAGLDNVAFSLHTPDYLGNPALWAKKQTALGVLRDAAMPVDNIAFSLRSLADLEPVMRAAHQWWTLPAYFKLRVSQDIGWNQDQPFFLSQFLPEFEALCARFGWPVEPLPADNSPYKFSMLVAGKVFRLIRWPTVHEIDLGELQCPPYALFVPELGEVNIVHAIIAQAAQKQRAEAA